MKQFVIMLLFCCNFMSTLCKHHNPSEMVPLVFIKEQKIELNLRAFQVGVWKVMKLDGDGYLHNSIPETAEHKDKFIDVLPIIFAKDAKLMLNIGAFHTGLYGHVMIDLTQNTTAIETQ